MTIRVKRRSFDLPCVIFNETERKRTRSEKSKRSKNRRKRILRGIKIPKKKEKTSRVEYSANFLLFDYLSSFRFYELSIFHLLNFFFFFNERFESSILHTHTHTHTYISIKSNYSGPLIALSFTSFTYEATLSLYAARGKWYFNKSTWFVF